MHAGATLIERKAKYAYCITHGLTRDEAARLMDIPWEYFEKEVIIAQNRGKQG